MLRNEGGLQSNERFNSRRAKITAGSRLKCMIMWIPTSKEPLKEANTYDAFSILNIKISMNRPENGSLFVFDLLHLSRLLSSVFSRKTGEESFVTWLLRYWEAAAWTKYGARVDKGNRLISLGYIGFNLRNQQKCWWRESLCNILKYICALIVILFLSFKSFASPKAIPVAIPPWQINVHKFILSPHSFPLVEFQLWTRKTRSPDVRHAWPASSKNL